MIVYLELIIPFLPFYLLVTIYVSIIYYLVWNLYNLKILMKSNIFNDTHKNILSSSTEIPTFIDERLILPFTFHPNFLIFHFY